MEVAEYRRIVGRFATGVTIVTTARDGWLHGITANAFTSVSLDPMLLLVCVDKDAHAHEELAKTGRFAVNILSEDQEELSNLFASKAPPEQGRLRGAHYHRSPHNLPIIEGCIAYFDCAVVEQYAGGDHTIFVGEVLDGEVVSDERPLLFHAGAYGRLR